MNNMKKILMMSVLLFAACKYDRPGLVPPDDAQVCPDDRSAIRPSSLAMCADFVNSVCVVAVGCTGDEIFSMDSCVTAGLEHCVEVITNGAVVHEDILYNQCLPEMKALQCSSLMEGEFPSICEEAIEEKE